MGFTIKDAASAEHVSQTYAYEQDFKDILVPAFSGTGVVTGCAVTAQGSPNMTVAVAAGSVAVAGTVVAVAGGNVTITAADGTHDRFDLICVDNAGAKSVVAGVAAATPKFPDPAGKVVLAVVRVPTGIGSINTNKITDKRVTAVVIPVQEPTGKVSMFAGSAAPTGYLMCDGAAVSRSTYATLYALVGTTYGVGDNSTTFNVPDMRGRTAVGVGTHADVNALAKNEGVATTANRRPKHKHTDDFTLPNHHHSITDPTHDHAITDPSHHHSVNGYTSSGGTTGPHIDAGATYDPFTVVAVANTTTSTTGIDILPGTTGITVDDPTTNPAIGKTIGVGAAATDSTDAAPYLTLNYVIKT